MRRPRPTRGLSRQKKKIILYYDVIYLLTTSGLPPGGSCTIHIYTQTIHRTTWNKQYIEQHNFWEQHKNFGRVQAVPRLGELYPGICLTTEEKARKNLSQGGRTYYIILYYIILYYIISYYILVRTGARPSVFIVHFEAPFCNFSRTSDKKIELNWIYGQFDLRKIRRP
jgi:hypothetical protein